MKSWTSRALASLETNLQQTQGLSAPTASLGRSANNMFHVFRFLAERLKAQFSSQLTEAEKLAQTRESKAGQSSSALLSSPLSMPFTPRVAVFVMLEEWRGMCMARVDGLERAMRATSESHGTANRSPTPSDLLLLRAEPDLSDCYFVVSCMACYKTRCPLFAPPPPAPTLSSHRALSSAARVCVRWSKPALCTTDNRRRWRMYALCSRLISRLFMLNRLHGSWR